MVAFDKGPKDNNNKLSAELLSSDILVSHQTAITDGAGKSQLHTHVFACQLDQALATCRTIPLEFVKRNSYMEATGFTLDDVREVCEKIKEAADLKKTGQTPPTPNPENTRFS